MNQALIRSDRSLIRSDEPTNPFRSCLAQTPPPTGEQLAADRTSAARHIGRDLQALRSPKLPLCRWTRAWSEAISVHQPAWWATTTEHVPNGVHVEVAELIDNFRKMREMLNEICAINAELLRRREELG